MDKVNLINSGNLDAQSKIICAQLRDMAECAERLELGIQYDLHSCADEFELVGTDKEQWEHAKQQFADCKLWNRSEYMKASREWKKPVYNVYRLHFTQRFIEFYYEHVNSKNPKQNRACGFVSLNNTDITDREQVKALIKERFKYTVHHRKVIIDFETLKVTKAKAMINTETVTGGTNEAN